MDYEEADGMVAEGLSQYQLGRRMTISGALKAGEGLVHVGLTLPWGNFSDYLRERDIPRASAYNWISLYKSGLSMTAIEANGGIRATIEIIKSQEAELSNVGQIQKEDHGVEESAQIQNAPTAITTDDNVPPPYFPEMEFEEGEEPVPQTAEKAMAEVPLKMEEPVKKPSQLELFQGASYRLEGRENTDLQYRLESMERQLKEAQQQAGMPHEKAAVSNRQEAIISALRSELHQERVQHNELKDAHRGAVRKLRQLEVNKGNAKK